MTITLWSETPVAVGEAEITAEEHHYLAKVRRAQPGSEILLLAGKGYLGRGRVLTLSKSSSVVDIESVETRPAPPVTLTVVPALIKGERMEWCVAKLVELGVATIRPMFTEHTVARPKGEREDKRVSRLQAVVRAAARQCQNPWPATIEPLCSFSEALKTGERHQDVKLIAAVSETQTPLRVMLPPEAASATVLVGPEGGFSASEIELARAAGFAPAHLGPRILRAETACVVLATLLAHHFGDLG